MTISAFIADDELFAREELKHQLSLYSDVELVGEAGNGIEALKQIKNLKPEVIFLDIEMPGIGGMELADLLQSESHYKPFIILVTAYEDYALKAFEYDILDYLLKPIDRKRFLTAISRVIKYSQSKKSYDRITAKKGSRIILIQKNEISYIYSDNSVVYINSKGHKYSTTYRTLDEVEKELDSSTFFRTHRSYIVNLKKVIELKQNTSGSIAVKVDEKSDFEIPVARSRVKEIKTIFNV